MAKQFIAVDRPYCLYAQDDLLPMYLQIIPMLWCLGKSILKIRVSGQFSKAHGPSAHLPGQNAVFEGIWKGIWATKIMSAIESLGLPRHRLADFGRYWQLHSHDTRHRCLGIQGHSSLQSLWIRVYSAETWDEDDPLRVV